MKYLEIALVIYLIGLLLNYFRMKGMIYEMDEKLIKVNPISKGILRDWDSIIYFLTSWLGFIIATQEYFRWKEKYFFKFSLRPLRKQKESFKKAFRVFENGVRCNDCGILNWKIDTHSTFEGAVFYANAWAFPMSTEAILNSGMITPMKLGVEENYAIQYSKEYPVMMKIEEVTEECELTWFDKQMIEWGKQNPHINLNELNQ